MDSNVEFISVHSMKTEEFLRNEINADDSIMRSKFAQGSEYINKWWKRKSN